MNIEDTETREEFIRHIDVDDALLPDLLKKLDIYSRLLREWNSKINLVSNSTLKNLWIRHFLDSAQLFPLIPSFGTLADLGSGAGFPGLVLAIMGIQNVTMIERDTRKAGFMRTVAGETGTGVEILNLDFSRIENRSFDILTSRALADLSEILEDAQGIMKSTTLCLFLKGKNLDLELQRAQKSWAMNMLRMPSITDPESFILRLTNIHKTSKKTGS